MTVRSFLKLALPFSFVVGIILAVGYLKKALPILSGYGAKNLCSCVMVGLRTPQDVIDNELASFPLNLGDFSIDWTDSSATGSVYGMAKRKAIYREGFGCTLISQTTEEELRAQRFSKPKDPKIDQDTIPWPYGNQTEAMNDSGLDAVALNQIIENAFEYPESRRTRAILVVHQGQIIAEKYAEGFDRNSRQMGWSMTKSLTNAIVGKFVDEGRFRMESPAAIFEWKAGERREITLDNLMRMSSGLGWNEKYSGPSQATNMLFRSYQMGFFAAAAKLKDKPGDLFYYSSGTSNIISRIIRQSSDQDEYYQYPYEALFHKIGMFSLVMEPDASGTFVGSSYAYATARDWARFGLLYLYDGVWQGERLLPEGWVDYSTTATKGATRGEYGAHFWLNTGSPEDPTNRMYPSAPTDLYWADGFEGQNVFIIPSRNLVVVKLSQTTGDPLNDDQFLSDILAALPK
ncbi:MAG: serine hydrolase [Cyclobacteriaceae bacterium]